MIKMPEERDGNRKGCDSSCRQPDVVLLNEKQWSYVRGRYDLTPRELEIARLICQGLRNGKIASMLRIRPGTVKTHTRNIYRKVHVKSKIGMLLRFVTDTRGFLTKYERFSPAPSTD